MRHWLACIATLVSLLASTPALACGVSGPDGAVGCSVEEHDEEVRPRWTVGAAGGYTWTKLVFGGSKPRAKASRSAALATLSYAPTPRLRFTASAGVAISGQLRMPDGDHEFSPGPLGSLGFSYRFLTGRPFLLLSGLLSGTTAQTRLEGRGDSTRYTAFDLRAGLAAGYTFLDALSPYAVVRLFGGPVFWHYQGDSVIGTDLYHVQLGAGLAWRIAGKVDLFVEGVPLGERAVSGGIAAVF
jgi:hypothetical protein